ncbi:MAG TPA: hypothetical protein VMZ06_14820 [Candidatus Bathyarchaeia archaeon]|nr:hypothetical protein [Candidatus Bathyarchaeia archaeon]
MLAALLATPALVRACSDLLDAPYIAGVVIPIHACAVIAACFLLWWAYHWRIGIDAYGVHRRVLFVWQHWPWSLFEEGKARRGATYYSFKFIGEAPHRNTIDFGPADEQTARQALNMCYAHWVQPPRLLLPDKLMFNAGMKSSRVWWRYARRRMSTISLSPQGLWINQKRGEPTHHWTDVKNVVLFRPSREHDKCTVISFDVGGWPFMLEFSKTTGSGFFNPPSYLIAGYLETYVAPEEILVCTEDPPASMAELEERLSFARGKIREKGIGGIVLTSFLALINLFTIGPDELGPMNVLTLVAMFGSALQPILARMKYRRQLKELLAQREQLLVDERSATAAPSA